MVPAPNTAMLLMPGPVASATVIPPTRALMRPRFATAAMMTISLGCSTSGRWTVPRVQSGPLVVRYCTWVNTARGSWGGSLPAAEVVALNQRYCGESALVVENAGGASPGMVAGVWVRRSAVVRDYGWCGVR